MATDYIVYVDMFVIADVLKKSVAMAVVSQYATSRKQETATK